MLVNISDAMNRLNDVLEKDQITTNETVRQLHAKDESHHEPVLPDVVVYPRSTSDVQNILKIANEFKIPVVPFGVGSSLEGNAIPVNKGISIDFSLMYSILEIGPYDLLVKVQRGVT